MAQQEQQAETPTVLVVDDEIAIVKVLRDFLEAEGFGVLAAHDGAEALALLAQHPRQVFSRDHLLERIWDAYGDRTTVAVHIRRLREKLEDNPAAPRHLQTVWGVGYRFDP